MNEQNTEQLQKAEEIASSLEIEIQNLTADFNQKVEEAGNRFGIKVTTEIRVVLKRNE